MDNNLLSLVGLCSDECGEQSVDSLKRIIVKAASFESNKEMNEASYYFRKSLNQARAMKEARERVPDHSPSQHLDEVIRLLEEKKRATRSKKLETREAEKVITFGETHKVYFYSPKTSKEQDRLHHSFVGQKVRLAAEFEVGPVYKQCLRCISSPVIKPKIPSTTLLTRIQTIFQIDSTSHQEFWSQESLYTKGHLLFLLQSQLENLSHHTYYSKQSFSLKKDSHSKWLKKESTRVKNKIQKSFKDIVSSNSMNDLSFWTADELGFCWYDQIFRTLTAYDRAVEQKNANLQLNITSILQDVSAQFLRFQSGLKPIDLDSYFTEHSISVDLLLCVSPMSSWLLDEFATRYCVGALYKKILALNVFSKEVNPNLNSLVPIHALCGACLKFIQDDSKIFNMNELRFFNQTVKRIKKDLSTKIFHNIFHHFTIKNQDVLSMSVKLLVLLEESIHVVALKKEKITEVPDTNKPLSDAIIEAIQASARNFYKECMYTSVAKEYDANGVNIDRLTPEPPTHAKQVAGHTPRQFVNMIATITSTMVDFQSFNFAWLNVDVFTRCQEMILMSLSNDIKFFVRKDMKDFKPLQCLNLIFAYYNLCEDLGWKDQNDIIPTGCPLVRSYMEGFEAYMMEKMQTLCRDYRTWVAAGPQLPHTASIEVLTEECMGVIQFLRKLQFLQKMDPSISYLKFFSESMGRIWTTYIELVYNLFIDEFPVEQHASVHDVYLKANFRFTLTGGLESVKTPSSRRFSLFPKKNKIDHVAVSRTKSATLLTKRVSSEQLIPPPSSAPSYEIEIWKPKVILNKKKAAKYKLTKPKIIISDSMCVKMQTITYLQRWLSSLLEKEKNRGNYFNEMCEKSIALSDRVFHALVGTLIYVIDFTVSSQLDSMLEPKKKLEKVFVELLDQEEYMLDQLNVISRFFSEDLFKQFVIRLCITIVKSLEGLAFDPPIPKTIPHLVLVDLLAQHINQFHKKFGPNIELEGLVMDIHKNIEDLENQDYVSYKKIFDLSKEQIYGKECNLLTPRKRAENVSQSSDSNSTVSRSFSLSSGESKRRHSFDFNKRWKKDTSSSSKVSRTFSSSLSKEGASHEPILEESEPTKLEITITKPEEDKHKKEHKDKKAHLDKRKDEKAVW